MAVIFRRPKASISGKVMTKEMWLVDASLHTTHSYYSGATTIPQKAPVAPFKCDALSLVNGGTHSGFLQFNMKPKLCLDQCSPVNSKSRCVFTWNPEGFRISEHVFLLFSRANLIAIRKCIFLLDVIFKTVKERANTADRGSAAGAPQPRAVAPASSQTWPLYLSNISAEVRSFTLTISGG